MHDHHLCHNINTHGKNSNPQAHHLNYDAIIRNHGHCSQYRIHRSEGYLQRYLVFWKLVLLFQKLQLIDQRPIASVYKKTQNMY